MNQMVFVKVVSNSPKIMFPKPDNAMNKEPILSPMVVADAAILSALISEFSFVNLPLLERKNQW